MQAFLWYDNTPETKRQVQYYEYIISFGSVGQWGFQDPWTWQTMSLQLVSLYNSGYQTDGDNSNGGHIQNYIKVLQC